MIDISPAHDPDSNRIVRFGADGCLAPGWPEAGYPISGSGGTAFTDASGAVFVRWLTYEGTYGGPGLRLRYQRICRRR